MERSRQLYYVTGSSMELILLLASSKFAQYETQGRASEGVKSGVKAHHGAGFLTDFL
jgi:hypothetical protein